MHQSIPTNIITGFLGVGKTTAILHLLRNKPEHEVWSVLVNEFGEIGIDGAMLKSVNAHVREVPGGCICCVAGLPMKIALNMMITMTKPDRILIEPTGLGHPEEIINTLTGEYYDRVLDLRATLTLVDPRKLNDERYCNNTTFQDQIAVADVLIANKTDLVNALEKTQFEKLVASFQPKKAAVYWVEQGRLDPQWLDIKRGSRDRKGVPQQKKLLSGQDDEINTAGFNRTGINSPRIRSSEIYSPEVNLPDGKDFIRRENSGQGFYSCGWLFRPDWQFDFNLLFLFLTGIAPLRVKGVMNTGQGVFILNAENGVLSVNAFDQSGALLDSRMEIIDDKVIDINEIENNLLSLVVSKP
jgi:G3E family GTPase